MEEPLTTVRPEYVAGLERRVEELEHDLLETVVLANEITIILIGLLRIAGVHESRLDITEKNAKLQIERARQAACRRGGGLTDNIEEKKR